MIDKDLLSILACPLCKEGLEIKDEKLECVKCRRQYPIKDGIPVLLIDEAQPPSLETSGS